MKRIIMLSALALLLVSVGCARKVRQLPPEIVNSVEGSFTFRDKTVQLSHAYARRVDNEEDESKQDVLIVFTDRPAPWQVIDEPSARDYNLREKGNAGELLALRVRLTDEKKVTFMIYHGDEGFGYYPQDPEDVAQHPKAVFNPVSFTPNLTEGRLFVNNETKTASDHPPSSYPGPPSYKLDVSFKVALREDEWTGVYYKFPPTNLEPGKASGQLVVDGNMVQLNHAYARQTGYDMFDKTEVTFLLTEKPLAEEALKGESEFDFIRAAREAGNSFVICDNFNTRQAPDSPGVWILEKVPASIETFEDQRKYSEATDSLQDTQVDLSQFDSKALDGKIYSKRPMSWFGHTYEINVSFNAPVVISGDPATAPVTAVSGEPLPAGGGPPGQAYLNFLTGVPKTNNFQELKQLLESSQSAIALAEMKKSLATVPAEKEPETFRILKIILTMTDPRVEGGFVNRDKATLWVTGTEDGSKVTTRVNMHLEKGRWKVGRGSTK